MPQTCGKCKREYVTGQDDIGFGENEYATVKAGVYIELRGSYKSKKVTEEYFEEKNLCCDCATELTALLHDTYRTWLYG